ncbi:MAG: sugar phosphate nucleotidyltransferase [Bacteroidota bacterium]|nr:sugar phosphate nucleotidyltransferase [Bacteroidota bacterium]
MSIDNNYLIIMAGGVGSRFWPMSTSDCPKQFLDVLNIGRTLIQQTADRFEGIVPKENIMVVTSQKYKLLVREQLHFLTDNQILLEPCMRNTAPCIAYGVWKIIKRNREANIIVAPSDHLITREEDFKNVINEGIRFIASTESLLTLGMKAHKAETGYGYIHASLQSAIEGYTQLYPVSRFAEKPNKATAEQYLLDGDYFWNSGIFLWSARNIEKAIRSYLPEVAEIFDKGTNLFDTASEQEFINEEFPKCTNISVDYGILEKADNIYVKTADFGWSDLGTWGSLHEQSDKTGEGNVVKGNIRTFDTQDSIIRISSDKKVVVVQGLNNYIVVDTGEALLICNKDEEQRIKEFQAEFL